MAKNTEMEVEVKNEASTKDKPVSFKEKTLEKKEIKLVKIFNQNPYNIHLVLKDGETIIIPQNGNISQIPYDNVNVKALPKNVILM